jgi:hypothetical protein
MHDQTAQVPRGTIIIRYIDKRDILEVLAHEKRTGCECNRMLSKTCIQNLGENKPFQVEEARETNRDSRDSIPWCKPKIRRIP